MIMNKGARNLLLAAGCLAFSGVFGLTAHAEELQDMNPYRQQTVTAMDEYGNITEIGDSDGIIDEGSGNTKSGGDRTLQSSTTKIVNFNTKNNQVTNYTEDGTGNLGYTNGDYGADAAYLGESNGKVKFMMSGVVGWVNASEVQVIEVSQAAVVSGYHVENGRLIHGVVHDMTTPGYRTKLDNGAAPSYLKADVKYYSYDGHYFYQDYSVMLKDYQNNTRANSVNPNTPYYNYYQYLPFRSVTSYSADTLSSMINQKTSSYNHSLMSNRGSDFVNAQNTYGVNALLMTGIAANESAWGTSNIAQTKNNLFGLNATDANPGENASVFESVQACINDFANGWLSKGYLYPRDSRYCGGFLGNKASGLGVKYASDPYWGERNANLVYALDKLQGNQDYQRYTIGLKDTISPAHNSLNVYKEASTSSTLLYETGKASCYAMLILDENPSGGFYKIQSDGVLTDGRTAVTNATGNYHYGTMYAYIPTGSVYVASKGSGGISYSPFQDVSSAQWFYEAVMYVNDKGLMTGLDSQHFGPADDLARAQFAVILHRMNGKPEVSFSQKFPDIGPGEWYTSAVLWASNEGIVTGYTDTGLFGPSDEITREQMAAMMYRYAQSKGYDVSQKADYSKYPDAANVQDFAKEAMSWAVGTGIITGTDEGTRLNPQGNANRAECATIIMRFTEKYGM